MALGPDYDVATHFTPRYNPWDQRLCLVPDGDLFKAIRDKRASVVTDEIDTFTEERHPAEGRQRAGGRHHRHRHRPRAAGARRHGGQRRRPRGRSRKNAELQGHDVFGRAQPGVGVRLHQRVLDAEMRPDLRICLPPDQLHGPARLQAVHAAQSSIPRSPNCRRSISPPAMCSARSRNCRSRARSGRGGSTRTTRSTSSRCATARSTTG